MIKGYLLIFLLKSQFNQKFFGNFRISVSIWIMWNFHCLIVEEFDILIQWFIHFFVDPLLKNKVWVFGTFIPLEYVQPDYLII